MAPGDGVLVRMHYTLPERSADLVPDRSTLLFTIDDEVESTLESVGIYNATWPQGTMPIPADDGDERYAIEYDPTYYTGPGAEISIVGLTLHMHFWGSSGELGIRRQDGSYVCLLQIDNYDQDWQGNYVLVEPATLHPGDRLSMDCHFDNSFENQPVVLGERQPARDLNWSEGADGEMCWGSITISRPRTPPDPLVVDPG